MRVAVQKLDGVESGEVSLQQKTADIRLRKGNRITLSQLRSVVKNAGFTAREANVSVVGTLVERGGKPALEITGLETVILLASDPAKPEGYTEVSKWLRSRESGSFEVVGIIKPPAHESQPEALLVQSVAPSR